LGLVDWSEEFSVGIPRIDHQHKGWFELINILHDTMARGEGDDMVDAVLEDVAAYTRTHFSEEEALMEKYGFPGLAGHKRVHEAFVAQLRDAMEAPRTAVRVRLTLTTMATMKDWLVRHIQQMDQHYATFILERMKQNPPS
jgi:hemerythrin